MTLASLVYGPHGPIDFTYRMLSNLMCNIFDELIVHSSR